MKRASKPAAASCAQHEGIIEYRQQERSVRLVCKEEACIATKEGAREQRVPERLEAEHRSFHQLRRCLQLASVLAHLHDV